MVKTTDLTIIDYNIIQLITIAANPYTIKGPKVKYIYIYIFFFTNGHLLAASLLSDIKKAFCFPNISFCS